MVHRKKNQPQSPQRAQSVDAFLCVLCALCGFLKPGDNKVSTIRIRGRIECRSFLLMPIYIIQANHDAMGKAEGNNGKVYLITNVYKCNMIVSNASTMILLAKVSVIRKFLREFGEIIIPEEVEKEITEGNTFDSKLLKKEIEDSRITVKAIKSNTSDIMKEFRITGSKQI